MILLFSMLFSSFLAQAQIRSPINWEQTPEGRFTDLIQDNSPAEPDFFIQRNEKSFVALYVDRGAWFFGQKQLKRLLQFSKQSYRVVTAKDLREGFLQKNPVDLLIMPGGKSWKYLEDLGVEGAHSIREYIKNGGSYFGICAGAYFAVSQRQGPSPKPIPYGIGLLDGVAYDGTALKTSPFRGGMMSIQNFLPGFKSKFQILMLGGPSFHFSEQEKSKKQIEVLQTFAGINTPALIRFQYGQGKVLLSGPHGEVEENHSLVGLRYKDPDSEWPMYIHLIHGLRQRSH